MFPVSRTLKYTGGAEPAGWVYSPPRQLQGYLGYTAAGVSLLEPPLQLYWTWLLQWIPLWMAPNSITLLGLAINMLTTLVLISYCPTVTEEVGPADRPPPVGPQLLPLLSRAPAQVQEFTQTHIHQVGDAIQPSHPVVPFSSCPQSLPASELHTPGP